MQRPVAIAHHLLLPLLGLLALGLSACGGGGGTPGAAAPPAPPQVVLVEAGAPQVVFERGEVLLQGSVENAGDVLLAFRWEQVAGAPVTPTSSPGTSLRFVAPAVPGTSSQDLVFSFTATTDTGASASDEVTVTVEPFDPVVYAGTSDVGLAEDLWVANALGTSSQADRRTRCPAPGATIRQIMVSPDGRYAAFMADHDTFDVYELYFATLSGAVQQSKVRLPLTGPASLRSRFRLRSWSPDGSRFLFMADDDGDFVSDLYVADPSTGAFVQLSSNLATDLGPGSPLEAHNIVGWSPDSTRVAFLEAVGPDASSSLCVIQTDGMNKLVLTPTLPPGGHVGTFEWSPTSERLAYLATERGVDMRELFCVNADGSEKVRISRDLAVYERARNLRWAPDGRRIAFTSHASDTSPDELFTALPDGTGVVRASAVLPAASSGISSQASFWWSPTSARIAYLVDQDTVGMKELYTSAADGSDNQKVNDPLAPGTSVTVPITSWSPDGTRLFFLGRLDGAASAELHTGDARGAGSVAVHQDAERGYPSAYGVEWSKDSSSLLYVGAPSTQPGSTQHAFVSHALGTGTARLTPLNRDGTQMLYAHWSASGERAMFTSDAARALHFELYAIEPFVDAEPTRISHTPIPLDSRGVGNPAPVPRPVD